jgi:hypothetical protein
MSVVFSGTNQGRFTANGKNIFLPLPPGADYVHVLNESIAYGGAPGANTGVIFDWYLGDTTGRGTVQFVTNGGFPALNIGQIAVGAGFYFIDTTNNQPGPLNNGSTAITAISTATPPRVTVGSTAGMFTGQTVQLYNVTGAPQLNGLQFSITVIDATHFDLTNCSPLANAATGGSFRVIPYQPLYTVAFPGIPGQTVSPTLIEDPYWYPTSRVIGDISQANQAIITLLVTHTYTIGQSISLRVPTVSATVFGMPTLNDLQDVTIVNINQADVNGYTNTITVDLNTTGIGPWAFPDNTAPGYTPAQVIPVGANTAQGLASNQNILADATVNQSNRGVLMVAGALSPAGANGNIIQWVAGKSFNGF